MFFVNNFVTEKPSGALICAECSRELPPFRSLLTAREALMDHAVFYNCGGTEDATISYRFVRVSIDGVELSDPEKSTADRIQRVESHARLQKTATTLLDEVSKLTKELEQLRKDASECPQTEEKASQAPTEPQFDYDDIETTQQAEEKFLRSVEEDQDDDSQDEEYIFLFRDKRDRRKPLKCICHASL